MRRKAGIARRNISHSLSLGAVLVRMCWSRSKAYSVDAQRSSGFADRAVLDRRAAVAMGALSLGR